MTRNTNNALAVCCGAARHGHRGTGGLSIRPWLHRGDQDFSWNEPARLLGTVTGVLNGAVTVTLLSPPPNV